MTAPGRYAQLHVCLLSLHMFSQEHGHLPVVLGQDQADEVVRIAEEVVGTVRQVRYCNHSDSGVWWDGF